MTAVAQGVYQLCFKRTDRHLKKLTLSWKLIPNADIKKPADAAKTETMLWQLTRLQENLESVGEQMYEASDRAVTHAEMMSSSKKY